MAGETRFYRTVSTRIGYGEYWRILKGNVLHFLIASAAKTIGASLDFGAVARPERLLIGEAETLPAFGREAMRPIADACLRLGFVPAFTYLGESIGSARGCGQALLAADGRAVASILSSRSEQNGQVAQETQLVFISRSPQDVFVVTTNGRRQFGPVPGVVVRYGTGAAPEALWKRHGDQMKENRCHEAAPWRPEDVEGVILKGEHLSIDHLARRGVYVLMSPEETQAMKAKWAAIS